MKTYVVGGFCRDFLLSRAIGEHIEPKDKDYVVVGSSPDEMLELGYKQVGVDFPVFLHPDTGDEYALARKETKNDTGCGGFNVEWEDVTLEDDLARRDLTINSIAWGSNLEVIDPFGGRKDLEDKILRHTSDAFADDPVRVLRIARFLARFGDEWTVAPETYALCQKIAWAEFKNLTAERVFLEMNKALSEPHPWLFFEFLYMLDYVWFKELFALKGIPQPVKHHPENCTFDHVMLCLKRGVHHGASPQELYAILCHDLGKAPCWEARGNLYGHEETGVPLVEAISERLKVPAVYKDLAIKVCRWHQRGHKAFDLRATKVHDLLVTLGCFRNGGEDKVLSFRKCNRCDAEGRTGFEDRVYRQADYLLSCYEAANMVDVQAIAKNCTEKGQIGWVIGETIRVTQIDAIKGVKKAWDN